MNIVYEKPGRLRDLLSDCLAIEQRKNIFPVETLEMATRKKIDEGDAQGRPMRFGMRKDDLG